ncbi:MAG: FkbM family methyltransferase [FCB group bacterium]
MLKKIIKFFINLLPEGTYAQKFYDNIFLLLLFKMNIGKGANTKDSGEIKVLNYVKRKLSGSIDEIIIFDVGANIGDYTQSVVDVFSENQIKVYAFEPSKQTYDKLSLRFKDNNSVIINNTGLSDISKEIELFSDSELSGLASVYNRNLKHFGKEFQNVELVSLKNIKEFCNENNIYKIDFLKLDVEGHEFSILKGAEEMFNNNQIKFIQFEFGGCNIDSRTYFQDFFYLLSDKFRIYRILKNGLYPIENYREINEIFITTNFFCELKSGI